jgi:hypothetical protein
MSEFTINVVQDPSTVIDVSSLDQAVSLDISQNQANSITIEDDVNNVLLNPYIDLSNYATIPYTNSVSGNLQTQISSLSSQTGSYVTGQVVRPSETGQFYPNSNPSGYISSALDNLNAGASIAFTKQVVIPSLGGAAFGTGVTTALALAVNTGSGLVTVDGAATLTNKTINGANNTITNVAISTGISGLGANVATFLATPTSANLAAAVSDETGTGSLVFGTSPTISNPTFTNFFTSSLIDSIATCVRDGPIPKFRLFEDFPNGNITSASIGTHGWSVVSQGGSGTNTAWTQPFSNRGLSPAAGVHSISSGAVSGNYRFYVLSLAGGSPIGQSFQTCFALAQITACSVRQSFNFGQYNAGINLDIATGTIKISASGPGVGPSNPYSVDVVTGLTFATGNFFTGTRYRLHFKIISSTQIDIYLASAPFNSSTWTTMYSNAAYTLPSGASINYASGENMCQPQVGIATSEAVTKTIYIDWASIERDIDR